MQGAIKQLVELTAEFEYMFQEGAIMSEEEQAKVKGCADQLNAILKDIWINDPQNKDRFEELYLK